MRTNLSVRLTLGALCALVGAGLFLLWKSQPSPAEAAYERGKTLASTQSLDAAVTAYQEAVRLDPRYAPPYRALAEIASDQGDLETAATRWQEYLSRAPHASHAWCRLAGVWMRANKGTEALRAAKEELKQAPDCGRANLIAGQLYERASQVRPALEHLAAAVRAYPDEPRIQLIYGRVLARTGDTEHAEPLLREVVAKDPTRAEAYRWLGTIYARRQATTDNTRLAEQNLRQAIELKPDYAEAHNELAQLLFTQHRAAEALPQAEEAAALRKHFPPVFYLLARIYATVGKSEEAKRARQEFTREKNLALRQDALLASYRQDRRNVGNALELAQVLIARDSPADALAILQNVASHAPNDARIKAVMEQAEADLARNSKDAPASNNEP